jgi:hypothetical protein
MIGSFSSRCPKGGACLRAIAAEVGCRGDELLSDPVLWLDALRLSRRVRRDGAVAALPSFAHIDGWHSRLMAEDRPLRYLMRKRGLHEDTLVRYRLGWDLDTETITLPVYDGVGEIANLRRRKLGKGEPFVGLAGRGSQLYPRPEIASNGALVVCEGEFDALVLNQLGFAAVTSTAGAGHWNPDWTPLLRHRFVAVMYDVDAEHLAEQRAEQFRAAGVDAFAVHLSRGGFEGKADVSDALVGAGKSAGWLRQLIRRERAAA